MLRQVRLTKPRQCVYPKDEALLPAPMRADFPAGDDGEKAFKVAAAAHVAAWEKYDATHDPAALPIRAGATATVFAVRCLTTAQLQLIEGFESRGVQMALTIAYGVIGVRGLEVEDGNGAVTQLEVATIETKQGTRLSDETLSAMSDDGLRAWLWFQVKAAGALTTEGTKSR